MSFAVIVLEDHEAPSGLRILPRDTALIGKGAPSLACQEYSHQQFCSTKQLKQLDQRRMFPKTQHFHQSPGLYFGNKTFGKILHFLKVKKS